MYNKEVKSKVQLDIGRYSTFDIYIRIDFRWLWCVSAEFNNSDRTAGKFYEDILISEQTDQQIGIGESFINFVTFVKAFEQQGNLYRTTYVI
jgi:hypothetical protein